MKRNIEELGYSYIWNIKKRGTKVPLNLFYVELKIRNNDEDIYEVRNVLG